MLFMVGGFSDSQYLHKKIKAFCSGYRNLLPVVPHRPWSVIARGAGMFPRMSALCSQMLIALALRGSTCKLVEKRCCRRHYGIQVSRPFRDGIDIDEGDCYYEEFSDRWYKYGWMTWAIAKVGIFRQV